MAICAVVGANWGDEGKGKMVDALASAHQYVVRFQGGANAGHTVQNDFGSFALHILPCGAFQPGCLNVIGPGVALDVDALARDLETLSRADVPRPKVVVSNRAELVLDYHKLLDEREEERLGAQSFGSTRQGIAPFYADKCLKLGVMVDDLFDHARFEERVRSALAAKNALFTDFYGCAEYAAERVLECAPRYRELLEPLAVDTTSLLRTAFVDGADILLEGQLGALRDLDHGAYPYVTSTSTLAGFASVGAGLPAAAIQRVVAVTKAYSSAVGAGPFPSELSGPAADELRERGGLRGEYGATTGRPRRIGWFDAVATRYGCSLQGATEVALTGLDTLEYKDELPICTAYEVGGTRLSEFPTPRVLERARAEYEYLPGFRSSLRGVRAWNELPERARAYVARVEELLGVPIRWVSTGPGRSDLVAR